MRDRDDGARVLLEEVLEPADGLRVEVVRGLVEQQHVRLREQQTAERHAPPLAARDASDVGVPGRQPQGVGGELECPLQVVPVGRWRSAPRAGPAPRRSCRSRRRARHTRRRPASSRASASLMWLTASSTLPRTSLAGSSCGSCGRKPILIPGCGRASPSNSLSTPAMIRSSVDLPEPLRPEHADLGARKETERDVAQDDALGRHDLADAIHGVDELSHGPRAPAPRAGWEKGRDYGTSADPAPRRRAC